MKRWVWTDDRLLSFSTIEAATLGDSEAISAVLKHFARYIGRLSMRTFYDEYGNSYEYLDPYLQRRLENKLIAAIIMKFKTDRVENEKVPD